MSAAPGQQHLIAVGSDSPQARLCDIRSGAFAHALSGHSEAVWACAWSPRSEFLLATGSADQTVRRERVGGNLALPTFCVALFCTPRVFLVACLVVMVTSLFSVRLVWGRVAPNLLLLRRICRGDLLREPSAADVMDLFGGWFPLYVLHVGVCMFFTMRSESQRQVFLSLLLFAHVFVT